MKQTCRNHIFIAFKPSFVTSCNHALKHFGLCTCAAVRELIRCHEDGGQCGVIHAKMPQFVAKCMK